MPDELSSERSAERKTGGTAEPSRQESHLLDESREVFLRYFQRQHCSAEIAQPLFERVPAKIKDDVPTAYSPDIKDALSEVLEANRGKWTPAKVDSVGKLLNDYGNAQPEAVAAVHTALERVSASHKNGSEVIRSLTVNEIMSSAARQLLSPAPERFNTQDLIGNKTIPSLSIETNSSIDGQKSIELKGSGEPTLASLLGKLNESELEGANSKSARYPESFLRLQDEMKEHEKRVTQARNEYVMNAAERIVGEPSSIKFVGRESASNFTGKAGLAGATLFIANLALDRAMAKAPPSSSTSRIVPTKK